MSGAFVEGFVRGADMRGRRRDRAEEREMRKEENARRREEFEWRRREADAQADDRAFARDTREGLMRAGQGLPEQAPVETRAIPTDGMPGETAAPAVQPVQPAEAPAAVAIPVKPEAPMQAPQALPEAGAPAGVIAVDAAPAAPPVAPAAAPAPAPAAPAGAIDTAAPAAQPAARQRRADPNVETARLLMEQAKYLVTRGDPTRAQQLFDQADKLEQAALARRMRGADAKYATTRDPRVYVDIYNDMVPDGGKITAMEPAGEGKWRIALEAGERGTGERIVTQAEVDKMVLELRDPAAMRAVRAAAIKEEIRVDAEKKLIEAKGIETRRNYQVLNEGREGVARIRASAVLARASGGGGGSGGDKVFKTETLADGSILVHYRSGRRELATDDNGEPLKGSEATRLAAQIYRLIAGDPTNRDPDKPGAARGVATALGGGRPAINPGGAPKPAPAPAPSRPAPATPANDPLGIRPR